MLSQQAPQRGPATKQIDIKSTTAVACEKCKAEAFQQALILRKVSALLTGEGKEGYMPIQVFSCASCGHVNEQFLPEELRSGLSTPSSLIQR
jgi:hypothetical protein